MGQAAQVGGMKRSDLRSVGPDQPHPKPATPATPARSDLRSVGSDQPHPKLATPATSATPAKRATIGTD